MTDMYYFKVMLSKVDMQHGFKIDSLDNIGMCLNIPVKKALEIVRNELSIRKSISKPLAGI